SVAVPLVSMEMDVASDASVQRIGTPNSPATHFFRDASGGFGASRRYAGSGSARGLGEGVLRLKSTVLKRGQTSMALGVASRLPTGDEEDLLGSGAPGVKPFLALSFSNQ